MHNSKTKNTTNFKLPVSRMVNTNFQKKYLSSLSRFCGEMGFWKKLYQKEKMYLG